MIEGAFLPRQMLDPDGSGLGFWWGTSRETKRHRNVLGWFVLHVIRECGITIWGRDLRSEIPPVSKEVFIEDLLEGTRATKTRACADGDVHSVEWLLNAARQILWLREGRLSSKSEAEDWGYMNAKGKWKECLPRAKHVRLNPETAECPDVRHWLLGLSEPIRESFEELEEELLRARQGS